MTLCQITDLDQKSASINMAEDSVVVTLVNQVSEDQEAPLGLVGVEEHHALEDEVVYHAESASEGDVEVDNVMLDAGEDGNSGSMTNITFDVRKRTLIMMWQRTILEEFYRAGMTSASMQLQSLHLDAAEKTGLDNTVIKVGQGAITLVISGYAFTCAFSWDNEEPTSFCNVLVMKKSSRCSLLRWNMGCHDLELLSSPPPSSPLPPHTHPGVVALCKGLAFWMNYYCLV